MYNNSQDIPKRGDQVKLTMPEDGDTVVGVVNSAYAVDVDWDEEGQRFITKPNSGYKLDLTVIRLVPQQAIVYADSNLCEKIT